MSYPSVILLGNIKPDKRICCVCGKAITGRVCWYVPTVARGKYLHTKPWGKSDCEIAWGESQKTEQEG